MSILSNIVGAGGRIEALYPFAIVVDREMRALELGRSIRSAVSELKLGQDIRECFRMLRPVASVDWTLDVLASRQDEVFVFQRLANSLFRLTCQVFVEGDLAAIVGSPAINSEAEFVENRLQFSDFSIIDPIIDLVFLLSTQRQSIRETEEMAASIKRSETQLRTTVENSHDAIYVLDSTGRIQKVNQVAAQQVCYSEVELKNMTIFDLIDDVRYGEVALLDAKDILRMVRSSSEKKVVFQATNNRNAGPAFPVEVVVAQEVFEEQSEYFVFVRDITSQHAYEQDLKEARDQALEASEAKSRFLAAMSHELRTPLNGIIGMTQLLEKTTLTAKQGTYLSACRASGETLLKVIGDILDFSKIEAGKLEMDEHEFSLLRVVEGVMQVMSMQQANSSVELACFVEPGLDRIAIGDSNRLRQVLFNLIGNALKFTNEGKVIVTVEEKQTNSGWLAVQFKIEDTGIGISPARVKKLFQPFTQADSSTTRKYGGTGLGLVIAKSLIELMNGEIQVGSEEGIGSVFTFDCHFRKARRSAESQDSSSHLNGLSVALVGGSAQMDVLVRLFYAWGVPVHAFTRESWRVAGDTIPRIDFFIYELDSLPEFERYQNPVELFGLASLDGCSDVIRAIALVQRGDELTEEECASLGVHDQLTKPVCQSRLFDLLVQTGDGGSLEAVSDTVVPIREGRGRVLLVEDNPVNQLFAQEALNDLGFDHVTANNGLEATQLLNSDRDFDLVLMDCQMPTMDGFQATRKIREIELKRGYEPLPIIALTANALAGDRETCLAAGMTDYMCKPFGIDELNATFERYIQAT